MREHDAKSWPNYRIDPRLKERLEKILSRAGDRSSTTKIINDILGEALDQVESAEAARSAMITVQRLRQAMGSHPAQNADKDLAERVLRMEQKSVQFEELVARLFSASETHAEAVASAKKKKAARKRAA